MPSSLASCSVDDVSFGTSDQAKDKIIDFRDNLKKGWDYGEGESFSDETAELALRINRRGKMFSLQSDAFPGIGGNIIVRFYKNEEVLEISVNHDGTFDILHEIDDEDVWETEGGSIFKALLSITHFKEGKWPTSDSSTADDMTSKKEDSSARRSSHSMVEYPSWTVIASGSVVDPFASTLENTISLNLKEGQPVIPLFSGLSNEEIYPMTSESSPLPATLEMSATETLRT